MKSTIKSIAGAAVLLFAVAAAAEERDTVTRVESKNVCMVNNASMTIEQIPVTVEGKTYYGCCAMCKEKLEKDASSRTAIDPVSGKPVDKATAVIGALTGGKVLYFDSEKNLVAYNSGERYTPAKKKKS